MMLSRLNAIVDADIAARAGWAPVDLAAAYLRGGARFVQIRAKLLTGAAFLDLALRVTELAHDAGAIVIVNDRPDIARLSGADGVHLGQDDLGARDARLILGAGAFVGVSTHTSVQIDEALEMPISYLAVGPVFGTTTKATGYDAVGMGRVTDAAVRIGKRAEAHRGDPESAAVGLIAIGGITLERASDVIRAGATSVAVITDLMASGDPEARVRAYLARLGETANV